MLAAAHVAAAGLDAMAFLQTEDPADVTVMTAVADKASELLSDRLQGAVARAFGG